MLILHVLLFNVSKGNNTSEKIKLSVSLEVSSYRQRFAAIRTQEVQLPLTLVTLSPADVRV